MNTARRAIRLMVPAMLLGLILTGCSDKSRMRLLMDSIEGVSSNNTEKDYLEVDMMGNFAASHCATIQDMVKVSLTLESPGALFPGELSSHNFAFGRVGPTFGGFVTGFRVDYFYYDPNDGALHGPVSGLTVNTTNMHQRILANSSNNSITIPLASYNVKAWAARASCASIPGFPGPGNVSRMIGRITAMGEDESGKKLSAQGDILMYMYDYGDYPVAPVGGVLAPGDGCFGNTLQGYWLGSCN